jgi:hypothetical protein
MELIKCEFCDKKLASKLSLENHIKGAKYCLKIRGESYENFECQLCGKKFSSKCNLQSHQKTCKKTPKIVDSLTIQNDLQEEYYEMVFSSLEKDQKIESLLGEISELKQKIKTSEKEPEKKKLDKKIPNVTNNKYNSKLAEIDTKGALVLTPDNIQLLVDKYYTKYFFYGGKTDIIWFLCKFFQLGDGVEVESKNHYFTDKSRNHTFHYLTEINGQKIWKKDEDFAIIHLILNKMRPLTKKYDKEPRDISFSLEKNLNIDRLIIAISTKLSKHRNNIIDAILKKLQNPLWDPKVELF